MEKIIKYLKGLSRRTNITVEILKTTIREKVTYQIEVMKHDKMDKIIRVEFEVNNKTQLKQVKQKLCEKLQLRVRRK